MNLTKKELIDALSDLDDSAQVSVLICYGSYEDDFYIKRVKITSIGTADGWKTADIMIDNPEGD